MLPQSKVHIAAFSPAKVNLFLAVTGKREDGFHDLISITTTVRFGDRLWITPTAEGEPDRLDCTDSGLDCGPDNLVLKAAEAFRKAHPFPCGLHIQLEKNIPQGAGLGGGSSNAAAVLMALNTLAGSPLTVEQLVEAGAALGSDVPLFLYNKPLIMRGRGEKIDLLPADAAARICGRPVLIFKPAFAVNTGWAYRQLAGNPENYLSETEGESKIAGWIASGRPAEDVLFNSFEKAVGGKYLAIPALLESLRSRFHLPRLMSGSGSACFALPGNKTPVEEVKNAICASWGDEIFLVESTLN